jgi:acetate kinase
VLAGLEGLGLKLDPGLNEKAQSREKESIVSAADSSIKILVIPTDEEIVFIEDVVAILEGRYETHVHHTYTFEDPKYRRKVE